MLSKVQNKIKSNLRIYKKDLKDKGLYYSIIHRLYKIPYLKKVLAPLVNFLKPDYIEAEGYKLYIDKLDTIVSENLLFSKKWEDFATILFKKSIRTGDTVLDIGAHIGYYTMIASKLVGDQGKVYAFEPEPKNFSLLKKNIIENNLKNVVLVNKAISRKGRTTKLYINRENTGDHRIYNSKDGRRSIWVKSIALDDFLKKKTQVNLIKMDIQGAEFEALKGGLGLIRKNQHIKILTEFWPMGLKLNHSSPKDFLALLTKYKFKLYKINEEAKKLNLVTTEQLLKQYPADKSNYTNLYCIKRQNINSL